jgi:unsaturated rhamnogalacturonyl hydrolase
MQPAQSLEASARKAAELLMRHPWKVWFWGDSIGLEGLLDASVLTGDERYADFVYGLLKAWIARRHPRSRFEYTAAGVALLRVHERTGDEALLQAALDHAEYLAAFRRTDSGAYVRYEDAAIELPPELPASHPEFARFAAGARNVSEGGPCVFVDNMHFDGPFFSRLYSLTGEDRFRELAVDNILPSIELLFDKKAGLFHHFWQERTGRPNGVLWGRGNGWAMLGLMHALAFLPESDAAYPVILGVIRRQAEALANLQDPSGDWHTVLDDAGSYLETSIAAFVVDGFCTALRQGWLPPRFRPTVDRALEAVRSHVEPDGKLSGVSYETFPSTRPEHYRQMPRDAVVPWGQGPLLTALLSHQLLTGAHT